MNQTAFGYLCFSSEGGELQGSLPVKSEATRHFNSKQPNTFVVALHHILAVRYQEREHSELITWNEEGSAFHILKPEVFAKIVLPKFYKHNNLLSFIRQLNMYSFKKQNHLRGHLIYSHQYFTRDSKKYLKPKGEVENSKDSQINQLVSSNNALKEQNKILAKNLQETLNNLEALQRRYDSLESEIQAAKYSRKSMFQKQKQSYWYPDQNFKREQPSYNQFSNFNFENSVPSRYGSPNFEIQGMYEAEQQKNYATPLVNEMKLSPQDEKSLLTALRSEFECLTIFEQNDLLITIEAAKKDTLKTPVIVKCLNTFSREYKENKQAVVHWFLRELSILQALKGCNNIIQIKETAINTQEPHKGWFVLSHYRSLADLLKNGEQKLYKSIPAERFILDVVSALRDGAMKCDLIYVMLSPSCIGYVEDDQKFVITSWENTIQVKDSKKETIQQDSKIAKEYVDRLLTNLSSNEYASPEIKNAMNYESAQSKLSKSGIFSLALITLEMCNVNSEDWKSIKYQSKLDEEKVGKIFKKARCSDELKELLLSMLSVNPNDRPDYDTIIQKVKLLICGSNMSFREDSQKICDQSTIFKENTGGDSQMLIYEEHDKLSKNHQAPKTKEEHKVNDNSSNTEVITNSNSKLPYNKDSPAGMKTANEPSKKSPNKFRVLADETLNDVKVEPKNQSISEENTKHGANQIALENLQNDDIQSKDYQENMDTTPQRSSKKDEKISKSQASTAEKEGEGSDSVLLNISSTKIDTNLSEVDSDKVNTPTRGKMRTITFKKRTKVSTDKASASNIEEQKCSSEQQENKTNSKQNETITYHNGDTYQGEWSDGKWHGQGLWTSGDKQSQYQGSYYLGKREGLGRMQYSNSDVYEGEWEQGKKNGKGKYEWKIDGSSYVGGWKEDKRDGEGSIEYANGEKYVGCWKNDYFEGRGIYTWPDGRKYEGGFSQGKFEGKGKMDYPGGDYYNGDWKNDLYEGEGEYYCSEEETKYKICSKDGQIYELLEADNKESKPSVIVGEISGEDRRATVDKEKSQRNLHQCAENQ